MDRPTISPTRMGALALLATIASLAASLPAAPARAQAGGGPVVSAASYGWQYVSPLPGADLVSPGTNVILRPGGGVDPATVSEDGAHFTVTGSVSGRHEGRARLSDDGRTITFRPRTPFARGETVTCSIAGGLRTETGSDVPAGSFGFRISGTDPEALRSFATPPEDEAPAGAAATPLPGDFPHVTASVLGRPSPGRIFLANFSLTNPTIPSYVMILENDGTPYFYRHLGGQALDFKLLPDGRLSYFDHSRGRFYAMDSTYADVDSFACGNGYVTDHHDLVVLPNGHALVMAYDSQLVDMSVYLPKAAPIALVVGLIIQEIDREKNVVFEWRSWDHFQITDMQDHPLNSIFIDYVHGNSLALDLDGNIVLSSRHMNEVTKIDRATGDVIWRLGGKHNQFAFVNDPIGFSHQHDARILADGHLTLFDNGNFHVPPFSRAVEYELNTRKMTATLVWQYRHVPDVFGPATGSVQRLSTGNTLIGWGATTPSLTEVTPDGTVVSEMSLNPGLASYRAYRFDWPRPRGAAVTVTPHLINLSVDAKWITASIEAAGWNFDDVVPCSIRLGDTVEADSSATRQSDSNGNGIPDLDVRFDRSAAASLLTSSTTWLDVSGALRSGGSFRGYDIVRVTLPPGQRGSGGAPTQVVSASGALPARFAIAAGEQAAGSHPPARTLAAFDVRGRLVRRWRAAVDAKGRVSWDGRAGDGRPVASGIYFVRAEDGVPGPAAKVVIAR